MLVGSIPSILYCAQVRVYELGQLGMKFERHLDAEVVDFQVSCCSTTSMCTALLLCILLPHVKVLLPPFLAIKW